MLLPSPHRRALTLLLLLAVPACDDCRGRSRPYTPYTLGSASDSASAPEAPPPGSAGVDPGEPAPADAGGQVAQEGGASPGDAGAASPGAAAREVGRPSPEGGKRWPLDGGAAAEAPTGRSFETGLVLDADGDGARDLVAWARAPDGLRGELLFAPGASPAAARTLAALPGGLSARGCAPRVTLARVSAATLAFDYAPVCPPGQGEKAARWIAILRAAPPAAPELTLDLRVRAPAPGEALEAEVEAGDRDGDGREDVVITFAFTGAPPDAAPAVRAPLVFLDRPTGLSRDAAQPGEALRALAAGLNADAARKTSAAAVAPAARAIRRLHALLCEDAGGAPVVAVGTGALRCGELDLEATLARAEARAAATLERR